MRDYVSWGILGSMIKQLVQRVTFANVVASLALFVALGGSAYAITKLPAKSVGTKQLKAKAVTLTKIDPAAQSALKGQVGAKGDKGNAGASGQDGQDGQTGSTGPTQGFVTAINAGSLTPTPEGGFHFLNTGGSTFTTNTSGNIFVFTRGLLTVNCSSGTVVKVGLFVDNTAVTASGQDITAATATQIDIWGLTGNLSAGAHVIDVQAECTGAGVVNGGSSGGNSATGAILLGS
jgi:hypothetical protein